MFSISISQDVWKYNLGRQYSLVRQDVELTAKDEQETLLKAYNEL